jgi:hypothetical protein
VDFSQDLIALHGDFNGGIANDREHTQAKRYQQKRERSHRERREEKEGKKERGK